MVTPAQEERVHIHEAAHGLLAWLEGLRIERITTTGPCLIEGGGTPYYTVIQGAAMAKYNRIDDDDLQARVRVCLASVAEQERRYGVIESMHDAQDALDFCSLGGCKNGGRQIIERAMAIRESPNPAEAFYREHRAELFRILSDPQAQSALNALADRLKETGTLSGVDAVKALETGWGQPLPGNTIPAAGHGTTLANDQSVDSALQAALGLLKSARDILINARPQDDSEDAKRQNLIADLLQIQFKWHT